MAIEVVVLCLVDFMRLSWDPSDRREVYTLDVVRLKTFNKTIRLSIRVQMGVAEQKKKTFL